LGSITAGVSATSVVEPARARRTLLVACAAHALHDGYTDLIFVLLPVWQAEFAVGYGMLALLRGLYAGAMATFQMPAGRLAERWGGPAVLAIGTALAGIGYAFAGVSGGLLALTAALALSGAGSATQHPVGSAAVSQAYGGAARGPLATYNFAGDIGKAAVPALASVLLTLMPWRAALGVLAMLGVLAALAIVLAMPRRRRMAATAEIRRGTGRGRGGFPLLFAIGVLDTAVRMGLLTFLPFLLKSKGADLPLVGLALALVFTGGAAGKFAFGWLGGRLGLLGSVLLTESATAAGILAVLALPLEPTLALLPVLGAMLNGTSSVLYGTVPELAPAGRAERAFALFYTGVIGSGAVAPVLYGVLGDVVGANWATVATAATALATLPLAAGLAPRLRPNVLD
jgi:MFS family permease